MKQKVSSIPTAVFTLISGFFIALSGLLPGPLPAHAQELRLQPEQGDYYRLEMPEGHWNIQRSGDLLQWNATTYGVRDGDLLKREPLAPAAFFRLAQPAFEADFCGTWRDNIALDEAMRHYVEAGQSCYFGPPDNPTVRDRYLPSAGSRILRVTLVWHRFTTDAGTHPTISEAEVARQMNIINTLFESARIQFDAETVTHASSRFRTINPDDPVVVAELKRRYAINPTRRLNVYVLNFGASGLLGRGTFPWSTSALTSQGGSILSIRSLGGGLVRSVISHELGHTLGLWHTHHGVTELRPGDPCRECLGAANQDVTGDFASDTPPSPVDTGCAAPDGRDDCGAPWQNVQENIMSYGSCFRYFTPQQGARMRAWLELRLASWITNPEPPPSLQHAGPLTVTADGDQVRLTWVDRNDAETGFKLECKHNSEATWQSVGAYAANRTTAELQLAEGTYIFRIRPLAADSAQHGPWIESNVVIIELDPPLLPVQNLHLERVTDGIQIDLIDPNHSGETVEIQWRQLEGNWQALRTLPRPASGVLRTIHARPPAGQLYYRARSRRGADASTWMEASIFNRGTLLSPSDIVAMVQTGPKVHFQWKNNQPGVESTAIQRTTDMRTFTVVGLVDYNGNEWTDETVEPGRVYHYFFTHVNLSTGDESPRVGPVSVEIPGVVPPSPPPPTQNCPLLASNSFEDGETGVWVLPQDAVLADAPNGGKAIRHDLPLNSRVFQRVAYTEEIRGEKALTLSARVRLDGGGAMGAPISIFRLVSWEGAAPDGGYSMTLKVQHTGELEFYWYNVRTRYGQRKTVPFRMQEAAWYDFELAVDLNTVGEMDGRARVRVNREVVQDLSGLEFRSTDQYLNVLIVGEELWLAPRVDAGTQWFDALRVRRGFNCAQSVSPPPVPGEECPLVQSNHFDAPDDIVSAGWRFTRDVSRDRAPDRTGRAVRRDLPQGESVFPLIGSLEKGFDSTLTAVVDVRLDGAAAARRASLFALGSWENDTPNEGYKLHLHYDPMGRLRMTSYDWVSGQEIVESVAAQLADGDWNRVSLSVRLNDPGEANGAIRVRLNSIQILDLQGLRIRTTAQELNYLLLSDTVDVQPATQPGTQWFDNFSLWRGFDCSGLGGPVTPKIEPLVHEDFEISGDGSGLDPYWTEAGFDESLYGSTPKFSDSIFHKGGHAAVYHLEAGSDETVPFQVFRKFATEKTELYLEWWEYYDAN